MPTRAKPKTEVASVESVQRGKPAAGLPRKCRRKCRANRFARHFYGAKRYLAVALGHAGRVPPPLCAHTYPRPRRAVQPLPRPWHASTSLVEAGSQRNAGWRLAPESQAFDGCIAPASFSHTHTSARQGVRRLHCACKFSRTHPHKHRPLREVGRSARSVPRLVVVPPRTGRT